MDDPLAWARDHTPILAAFQGEYETTKPFDGYTVAIASHLEAKTGVFIETVWMGGARVVFAPSEPQSTHGDVVEALASRDGIEAYGYEGMSNEAFEAAQHELLDQRPDVVLDDGCELIAKVHADHPDIADGVIGGAEQTTAGIQRLEAMHREDVLRFPVYGVNDTPMKRFFDNVHGTGESSLANIAITTNATLAGKTVVIAGYGYVGRGIARKMRALGAHTVVTEVDPRRALQAHMDGHRIASMADAARNGDLFVTATGNVAVIREEHLREMQDNATLANAGHFDVEIDLDALETLADQVTQPTEGVTRYQFPDGRRLNVLADGRLVNLTGPSSRGHPAEIMDTTFAMMIVAGLDHVAGDGGDGLEPGLYAVPDRLDRRVAERKLDTLGVDIDEPTAEQREYAESWEHADSY